MAQFRGSLISVYMMHIYQVITIFTSSRFGFDVIAGNQVKNSIILCTINTGNRTATIWPRNRARGIFAVPSLCESAVCCLAGGLLSSWIGQRFSLVDGLLLFCGLVP